jgi:hypothetical protein
MSTEDAKRARQLLGADVPESDWELQQRLDEIVRLKERLGLTHADPIVERLQDLIHPICPTEELYGQIFTAIIEFGHAYHAEQAMVAEKAQQGDPDALRFCEVTFGPRP